MNEIGNDEVISALKAIIDQFGEFIEPHAINLINQLVQAFSSFCSAGTDDDDAVVAANECFECISTVLKGVSERPDIYRTVEPALLPVIKQILGNDGEYIEYIESALDVLTFLTFFQDELSAGLWDIFPILYVAFDQWAFDYFYLMTPVIENYIGKSPQTFLTGVTSISGNTVKFIDVTIMMVKKTITEQRAMKSEVRKALSLYMCILHNCRGLVDNYLPVINDDILGELRQSTIDDKELLTRIAIFQVLGSALYYNPQLQLQELEKRGATKPVFSQWIKDSDKMESWLSRKIIVLAFSSVLQLPITSLPPSFTDGITHIITCATKIMEKMEKDSQDIENSEAISEELEEEWEEEDLTGFTEDQDVSININDEPYIDALLGRKTVDDFSRFLIGDDWDEDDDDDDYASPIDDIDTLLFYTDSLNAVFQREPMVRIHLINTISNY